MRRTTVLTVLSFIAVMVAGGVAIGANLGILDAAESTEVGKLNAAEDLPPLEPKVVHVTDPATSTTTDPAVAAAVEDGVLTITEVVDGTAPSSTGPVTTSVPGSDDQGTYESDDHADEVEHEDAVEHEYEGSEDDD